MRHKGYTLIGRKGNDYFFADSVFDHGRFKGCTGSIVSPVSDSEWDYASDPENVAERYSDHFEDLNDSAGYTSDEEFEIDFADWIRNAINSDGIDHLMFDSSSGDEASEAFDELGIEHRTTDCSGGGRIFSGPNDFDEVFNRKALVAIEALEDGAVTADYAGQIVFG